MNINIPAKLFWKQLDILGSTMGNNQEFYNMLQFVNEKQIVPEVAASFGLNQCQEAAQFMTNSMQFGKIILDIK
jgi:D-arabinose 1-dehydrogenase-like Zn-dependent alcohol dehydrogenase